MKQNSPKTIKILLTEGDPDGIRIAEITMRTIKVVLIPRNKWIDAQKRSELQYAGCYFLIGKDIETEKNMVYVGESDDFINRINSHNRNEDKDFYNTIIFMTTKDNSFNKAHIQYLEWYFTNAVKDADRYILVNSPTTKPTIDESDESGMEDAIDTIQPLVFTLGHALLDKIERTNDKEIFVCKGKNAKADGKYLAEGFIVFKKSTANIEEVSSAGSWVINMRKKLREQGILKENGKIYDFVKDYIFASPSAAAAAVLGRRANGWTEWKNNDGKSLDEIKRRQ